MNQKDLLNKLLNDEIKPNRLHDVKLIMQYLENGSVNGDPIFLSLGESWTATPLDLIEYLSKAPIYTHGYMLSMYGIPEARKTLKKYLIKDYKIKNNADKFEVALSWNGTRETMLDFGKYLTKNYFDNNPPNIVMAAPGFDYDNIFESIGYQTNYVELLEDNGFKPKINDFIDTIKSAGKRSLVIINAQHNPTSINWNKEFVRELIKYCLSNHIAMMIDDAFFGVYFGDGKPTSSTSILIEDIQKEQKSEPVWLAVRTFGKQFAIQGWGLGAMVGPPKLIDELVNNIRAEHTYNYGGVYQYALSQWIKDSKNVTYSDSRINQIKSNKVFIKESFVKLFNYEEKNILDGDCTTFLLFKIPKIYQKTGNGVNKFIDDLIKIGIVLSDAYPMPFTHKSKNTNHVRLVRVHTAVETKVLKLFVERLVLFNFNYDMNRTIDYTN